MSRNPRYSTEAVIVGLDALSQGLVNSLTTIIDKLRNGTAPLTDEENELVQRITDGYRSGKKHAGTSS
ncbi:MAG: hypothetical protein KY395_00245 [Actinobacteria bacterium]|nr:hypothetical protein [Actinomycetota bacterium]